MIKIKLPILKLVLITTLASQLLSCGYLLYPERRGQHPGGKVDWAVAGLDAIGLVFFIIPGLIAFGVDLGTGALYFPKSTPSLHISDASKLDWKGAEKIKIDPQNLNPQTIAAAIKEHRGINVDLSDPNLKVYRSFN